MYCERCIKIVHFGNGDYECVNSDKGLETNIYNYRYNFKRWGKL